MKKAFVSALLMLCSFFLAMAEVTTQESVYSPLRIQKRYNIFFQINSPQIDRNFKGNAHTIDRMKADIDTTLSREGNVPDSLLILSTASPDGSYKFNKWLAGARAESTRKMLLEMFPEFENATIIVEFLEEDWGGLRQVLRQHPEFPQRERMLEIIDDDSNIDDKEKALRACKTGWRYLVNNYIHVLRNSSITISVIGQPDEFSRATPVSQVEEYTYTPTYTAPEIPLKPHPYSVERTVEWRKMILAPRMNLFAPGLNVGLEVPIKDNWSVGIDYYYPWFVSAGNKWCFEILGGFVDAKYWFPGSNYKWTRTERLQGHAIGVYAGLGYYDFQDIDNGNQGEYIDAGVDYTFSLPVADNKLRFEFNIGLGFMRTWYRPYHPSSDYEDLIKEPGIKYQATNFFGPTRAGVSLVVPIIVKTKTPKVVREGGER